MRGRIPVLQQENSSGYIHNSAHYATARFRYTPSTSIGEIAYLNRQALIRAIDPKDAEIGLTVVKEMVRRGQRNLACEPFERFFHVTSWCVAWKGLDFTSVGETREERSLNPASDLLVMGSGAPRDLPLRCEQHFLSFTFLKADMIFV